jgi:hypothetical protein
MARKTGKRGAAIVVLMIVGAIAASPGTASAGVAKTQAAITTSAPAPPPAVPVLTVSLGLDASWAEASWASDASWAEA